MSLRRSGQHFCQAHPRATLGFGVFENGVTSLDGSGTRSHTWHDDAPTLQRTVYLDSSNQIMIIASSQFALDWCAEVSAG
jgi:hypothetical protein